MENRNQEAETSQTKLGVMETPVGSIERPKLEPKDCVVKAVEMKEGIGKGGKPYQKLILHLQHPDKADYLNVSDAKVERRGGILKVVALFVNLDAEKKIEKGSPVAVLLSFYGVPNINALVGKTVRMTTDEKGYLAVKAY